MWNVATCFFFPRINLNIIWLQPFHNRAAPLMTVRWIPASMGVHVLTPPLDLPARVRQAMRDSFASMQWVDALIHYACTTEPVRIYEDQDTCANVSRDIQVNYFYIPWTLCKTAVSPVTIAGELPGVCMRYVAYLCQCYPGYFREPHWKSMRLPEISRVNRLLRGCQEKMIMP